MLSIFIVFLQIFYSIVINFYLLLVFFVLIYESFYILRIFSLYILNKNALRTFFFVICSNDFFNHLKYLYMFSVFYILF